MRKHKKLDGYLKNVYIRNVQPQIKQTHAIVNMFSELIAIGLQISGLNDNFHFRSHPTPEVLTFEK